MRKMVMFLLLLFAFLPVYTASLPGKNIGPEVSWHNGRELKWEEGSRDYFTLYRTMLSRSPAGNPTEREGNPQADGCLPFSSKMIVPGNLPDDAVVTDAFMIWTTGHTPDNPSVTNNQQYNTPTKNSLTLKFESGEGVSLVKEVSASQSYTIGAPPGFEFEGAIYEMDLHRYRMGVYTYRVEITDFFNQMLEAGREKGIVEDGKAYEGNYTVENMTCYPGEPFLQTTMLVGHWSIVFVYTSAQIKPKKIYFYNGLNFYRDTQSKLFISGFELPEDPSVRVSLLTVEGDPGLYNSLFEPEALLFRVNSSQQYASLSNICNPPMSGYTEVYNSISSYYPWDASDDDQPFCVGGIGGNSAEADINTMEWGLDFDTFLINESTYSGYLNIGDRDFEFVISANQDTIFSNMMIVSVDTKSPKFDIPDSGSSEVVPIGREKHSCSCSGEMDQVCDDRPFYYFIRVQNWGEDTANSVKVKDALSGMVTYVAGTTEMATRFNEKGEGLNWTYIKDGEGGKFPLSEPFEVAGQMIPCNKVTGICEDTVLIRFLVEPVSGLPKHAVINNTAEISDSSGGVYRTNSDVDLRVRMAQSCPLLTACPRAERSVCGGDKSEDGTDSNDDETIANNTEVTYETGKNSPQSEEEIIVVSPTENLVLGQISLKGISDEDGKYFKLNAFTATIKALDNKVGLFNISLVRDTNGNGIYDDGDEIIATVSDRYGSGNVTLVTGIGKEKFEVNTLHHILLKADVIYNEEDVPPNISFNFEIESTAAFTVSDKGSPVVNGESLKFQKYIFEPTSGYFIVTKGANDPAVPKAERINSNISMMQLRLKAVDGANEINSITVKTSGSAFAEFGKGIKELRLYLDVDKDGKVHTSLGDVLVAQSDGFKNINTYTFENLSIPFEDGEEKYLLVNAVLNLKNEEKAKIIIPNAGVKLKEAKSIYKLPISSKEFGFDCDPYDPDCAVNFEEEGCACTFISTSQPQRREYLYLLLLMGLILNLIILNGEVLKRITVFKHDRG